MRSRRVAKDTSLSRWYINGKLALQIPVIIDHYHVRLEATPE